ncbi:DUF2726 domain-containing protein [Vogesella indigofera]|uniref:DUF2726 domain-containing protein n=1 Tax=Vogesella indigofera TaxID=45465 RepID=UPI00234F3147|nr:DUF2726 domain-containing protein [Vogesella indigofera]MDC7700373.1 DUF2726 domain-containing protein [Vogesella indigofera]MDC7712196.1 DUF2726 domain-containing protein [Vogesella indigofera]
MRSVGAGRVAQVFLLASCAVCYSFCMELLFLIALGLMLYFFLTALRKEKSKKATSPFSARPASASSARVTPFPAARHTVDMMDFPVYEPSAQPHSPLSVFHSKPPLTAREASCYWSLAKNLNGHYIVLPQVAFSAFLFVSGGDSKSDFRRFATMRQKVADFLIVRNDFSIVALIELDDRSHENKKEADRQRDAVIKEAGIRVFRIPRIPDSDKVQRLCEVLLKMDQVK